MRTSSFACLVACVSAGIVAAATSCSTVDSRQAIAEGPSSSATPSRGGSASIPTTKPINTAPSNAVDLSNETATPGCGDGVLTEDEACDDGDKESGDGCLHNCKQVEIGYSCPTPGKDCHQIARCGDGVKVFPELCDDGNLDKGDGCSPACKYELGWKCDDQSPSSCSHTTCGDSNKEGAEGCDDGNTTPFDGCSADCQNEPHCNDGPCQTACGDGIVMNDEECDDGNMTDGDGCSSQCKPEAGFTCSQPELGDVMKVPMIVRDFNSGGDFEHGNEFAMDLDFANQGLVKPTLQGSSRKPALASTTGTFNGTAGKASGIASAASFAMWFDDSAPASGNTRNKSLVTTLSLFKKADGSAYVNRFGVKGDGQTSAQYRKTKTQMCGEVAKSDHDAEGNVLPCTACYYDPIPSTPECDQHDKTPCQTDPSWGGECIKSTDGSQWLGVFVDAAFDGNPLFFPADALTPANPSVTAQISGNYDSSWPYENGSGSQSASDPKHNFSFTTEVRYWFSYDAKKTYKLSFVGDDDVWVFINGRLAVDLGGVHTAVLGELTFGGSGNATTVVSPTNEAGGKSITTHPDLGLTTGNVYEIAVFQVERQTKASSYQLTLSGFSASPSDCGARCGDGIVGLGEECDDGANDGGYGECNPGCKLGEYCGDGIPQVGEDCDDGVNIGSPCPSGCRKILML